MPELTRSPRESIVISTPDGDVTVTVISIDGSHVRLGFTAPRAIPILRGELLPPNHLPQPKSAP